MFYYNIDSKWGYSSHRSAQGAVNVDLTDQLSPLLFKGHERGEIMNLSDIVALAKQGYKPSDIKELLSLASSEEGNPKEDKKAQEEKTEQHEDGKEQPNEAPKNSTEDSSEKAGAIDEYKNKIAELEEKVKSLQSANVHKDNSDSKQESDEDILNDITRSFM